MSVPSHFSRFLREKEPSKMSVLKQILSVLTRISYVLGWPKKKRLLRTGGYVSPQFTFDSSLKKRRRICTKIPVLSKVLIFSGSQQSFNFSECDKIWYKFELSKATSIIVKTFKNSVYALGWTHLSGFSSEIKGLTLRNLFNVELFLLSNNCLYDTQKWENNDFE